MRKVPGGTEFSMWEWAEGKDSVLAVPSGRQGQGPDARQQGPPHPLAGSGSWGPAPTSLPVVSLLLPQRDMLFHAGALGDILRHLSVTLSASLALPRRSRHSSSTVGLGSVTVSSLHYDHVGPATSVCDVGCVQSIYPSVSRAAE